MKDGSPTNHQYDRRDEFLLKMYEAFWNNITRAEDAAWKLLATYTALFAGLALAFTVVGPLGFAVLVTLFSFLAIALSLNANLWFVRNIGLIANLEKEFLNKQDYGVLIPEPWGKDKVPFFSLKRFEAWWVFVPVYLAVAVVTIEVLWSQFSCAQALVVALLFVSCMFLTIAYGWHLNSRHDALIRGAPGVSKL
jgi:hypothetical protein